MGFQSEPEAGHCQRNEARRGEGKGEGDGVQGVWRVWYKIQSVCMQVTWAAATYGHACMVTNAMACLVNDALTTSLKSKRRHWAERRTWLVDSGGRSTVRCTIPVHTITVPFWRLASHQRKVPPLYQGNLLGDRFIFEDPLHGGVRRS